MKRALVMIAMVCLLTTGAAEAQCDGTNLVTNCSFESGDTTAWSSSAP